LNAQQLLRAAPGIEALAHISTESIASIGSQNMTESVWLKLAKKIRDLFSTNQADGIVITHGTDTLEETAFFLDLVLPPGKPVVLVGAMRPATALSADGPANLYGGVELAASPLARGRGVLVVMNAAIHSARAIRKISSSSLPGFDSSNSGPLGQIDAAQIRFLSPPGVSTTPAYALPLAAPFPRVEIIYAHAQMDGLEIDDAVKRGARGLVIAGVGNGNCSDIAIEALARAVARGVVVVRASRVGSGFVDRNVEIDDDRLGFVASLDLSPQKARILTQLLIANGVTEPSAVQRAFGDN
jgi:L-asparaginase